MGNKTTQSQLPKVKFGHWNLQVLTYLTACSWPSDTTSQV